MPAPCISSERLTTSIAAAAPSSCFTGCFSFCYTGCFRFSKPLQPDVTQRNVCHEMRQSNTAIVAEKPSSLGQPLEHLPQQES